MRLKAVVIFWIIAIAICMGAISANCADVKCDNGGGMKGSEGMRPGQGPGDGMGMRDQMMDDLNLTQFQKDKMMELRSQCDESTKDLREDMRRNNEELDMLWKADNPDADAIKAKTAQGNEIHAKLQNIMIDNQIKFFSMLTTEQKAKAGPRMNMMMGSGMGMMGPGMGMGKGMTGPGMGGMREPGMKPMGPGMRKPGMKPMGPGMRKPGMKPMGPGMRNHGMKPMGPGMRQMRPGMGKMKGMKAGMCCPKCGTCPMCNKKMMNTKVKPAIKKSNK